MPFHPYQRRSYSGQSFGTCLLMVVLFFGGIGAYYFKVFQWRDLEDPLANLTIVKKDDPAEIAFFKKKTVPDMIDPALMQYRRLLKIRKETKKGTVTPPDFDQDCTEIANRLRDVMNTAKLRQIPTVYEKPYQGVLLGLTDVYHSLRSLQEAVNSDESIVKQKAYEEAVNLSRKGNERLSKAREVFHTQ